MLMKRMSTYLSLPRWELLTAVILVSRRSPDAPLELTQKLSVWAKGIVLEFHKFKRKATRETGLFHLDLREQKSKIMKCNFNMKRICFNIRLYRGKVKKEINRSKCHLIASREMMMNRSITHPIIQAIPKGAPTRRKTNRYIRTCLRNNALAKIFFHFNLNSKICQIHFWPEIIMI